MIPPSNEPENADDILNTLYKVCAELDITYFLYGGTALGFYRDGGYIPLDNDIDVGILSTPEKFLELRATLEAEGFAIDEDSYNHYWKHNILLDIRGGTDYWGPEPVIQRCVVLYTEQFDAVSYKGRAYNIPHPIEEHLACHYGPNWCVSRPKSPTVVFATICGDLFHIGHLRFLQRAAELGHILVVGICTDDFMRSYKGEPIIPYEQRCEIIQSLRCVDYITPYTSFYDCDFVDKFRVKIRVIRPEYGYYEGEAETRIELEARGIKHVELSRTPNISTTEIKKKCWEEVEENWELIEIVEEHDEKVASR